jgi:hypothetical protein
MEYILWGTKPNNESWQEDIITVTTSQEHLQKARKWAEDNSFQNIRVSTYNGEMPDFKATVRV